MSTESIFDMAGRGVVITGGAGYLGRAFAKTLVLNNADVLLIDLDQDHLASAVNEINDHAIKSGAAGKVSTVLWDLSDRSVLDEKISEISSSMNSVDVLINNAAYVGTSNLSGWVNEFEKQSVETFGDSLGVNLVMPFALSQKLLPLLKKNSNGSIINIGSIYGVIGPDMSLYDSIPGMGNAAGYAASKGGLLQLTRWLATVVGPDVRVNMISPGGIARGQNSLFAERYVNKVPLKRMGTEDDIVGTMMYLASDMSLYTTGQNIVVDGGFVCM